MRVVGGDLTVALEIGPVLARIENGILASVTSLANSPHYWRCALVDRDSRSRCTDHFSSGLTLGRHPVPTLGLRSRGSRIPYIALTEPEFIRLDVICDVCDDRYHLWTGLADPGAKIYFVETGSVSMVISGASGTISGLVTGCLGFPEFLHLGGALVGDPGALSLVLGRLYERGRAGPLAGLWYRSLVASDSLHRAFRGSWDGGHDVPRAT